MRFVILGSGAIGGVVGARLHQAGHEVGLVVRGAHYRALARDGLRLETPAERSVLEIPVVDAPDRIDWAEDHVVMLATKSQDTAGALASLRAFANVHGAVVVVPAVHLEPGVVVAYGTHLTGVIDLGRYPSGTDRQGEEIAGALSRSSFSSRSRVEIMVSKHAKLLGNLANAVEAVCGPEADGGELGEIAGRQRGGGSTWQSLARRADSVETDYLNGEIVLIGRLAGVDTPVNELLRGLVQRMVREHRRPGWLTPRAVLEQLRERESWTA
jgi:2-dehydropantoate 2-reductase